MESTLALTTAASAFSLFTISKALNLRLSRTFSARSLAARPLRRFSNSTAFLQCPIPFNSVSSARPVRPRLECVSSSAGAAFAAGGGGFGGGDGGDGGGGGGDGGDGRGKVAAAGAKEVSASSPDVIVLDVGGMTCGGCAASVKRILESQPQVSSASVNLTTETAIVWPISEAKALPNWQQQLGEALAKHLTNCGFNSNMRGKEAIEGDISP